MQILSDTLGQHIPEPIEEGPSQSNNVDLDVAACLCDTDQLKVQLHHNLATLFLKMQTVLHVSDTGDCGPIRPDILFVQASYEGGNC